jgi:hypothetical protein
MAVRIGHASIDENGKASGGAAGDQTGKEVCTRDWYNKPWIAVIRPKDSTVAEKIATAMEAACANDNIGYDQSQRTTLFTLAKAANWNIAGIKTKCETDCSALVAVCVNAAGISVSKDIYTGNEKAALQNTGKFTVLTGSEYIAKSDNLKRGDILLASGHTAVVLSNGSAAGQVKKSVAEIAKEVLAGKWGNGDDRKNRLTAAGYNYSEVQAEVNKQTSGTTTTAKKSVTEVAKEVIAGKWGNGDDRKKKLQAAGYDPAAVQKKVNELLK